MTQLPHNVVRRLIAPVASAAAMGSYKQHQQTSNFRGRHMGWGARKVGMASARRRLRFVGVALVAVAVASAASCKAPPQGISAESTAFEPQGVAWNGVKVY